MPAEAAVRPCATTGFTGPWSDTCSALAHLVADALAEHRTAGLPERAAGLPAAGEAAQAAGTPVEVSVLGVRDELSAASALPPQGAWPITVQLYGHQALIGPFPAAGGAGACPRCLARRWQALRSRPVRDALELGGETRAAGAPPWATPFTAAALAAVVAEHLARAPADPIARVYLVDLETLHISAVPLLADAECPRCDRRVDDSAAGARIAFAPAPKPAPGVFRVRPADGYRLPEEALVGPVAGVLGPAVVPDLLSVTTSSTAGCFTLRSGHYLRECYWGGHTGGYRASTRVGLLEGLERYAGMRARGKRTTVRAGLRELGGQALDPRECGLYDDAFHRREPHIAPFTPEREISWVWGYSLRDHRPVLVPEILAYYHAPGGVANRFVQESSNGCASGGCLAEAVLFGLLEVVERDAFLIAWYGRAPLPEIDPRSTGRADLAAMVDRLELYGYRARFFDTRITFPIPVVTAVAQRIDGGLGALCFGAGAALLPEDALAAGLSEIATDAVNVRRRVLRDLPRLRALAADFDKVQVLHDHPMLYGLPEMARHADFLLASPRPPRPLAQVYGTGTPVLWADLRDDLQTCVDAVTGAGFDVIVVDQTMPEQRDLGLHTASVIVPGLIPIDFGWRRQRALHLPRLRTALREAGLHERDLLDGDLNRAPHPFP